MLLDLIFYLKWRLMEKVISEPLKTTRLAEVVEGHIRDLILDGNLTLGARLPTEKELAIQFGVSVITAREALKGLQTVGLIEKRKGRRGRIFVAPATIDSLKAPWFRLLRAKSCSFDNLSELREIIEPAVSKIAASRLTDQTMRIWRRMSHHVNPCFLK